MRASEFPLPTIRHNYEGADWLQHRLSYSKKHKDVTLTPFGRVVADILGYLWDGIYNLNANWERWGVEFAHDTMVSVVVPSSWFSTYDSSLLTQVVVIAHLTGIRIQLDPAGPYRFRMTFHRRASQHLPLSTDLNKNYYSHPTLDGATENICKYLTVEWEPVVEPETAEAAA